MRAPCHRIGFGRGLRLTVVRKLDVEKGEILSCPGCGLELEVKKINNGGGCIDLQELTIEGEDWGE